MRGGYGRRYTVRTIRAGLQALLRKLIVVDRSRRTSLAAFLDDAWLNADGPVMERLVQLGLDPQTSSRPSLCDSPRLEIDTALVQRVSHKMAAAAKGNRALRLPPACMRSPPWLTSGRAQQCGGPVDADADVEESLREGAFNDLTAMYHLLHEQHQRSVKAATEPPTDMAAAALTSEDIRDPSAHLRPPLTVSITETAPEGKDEPAPSNPRGTSPATPVRREPGGTAVTVRPTSG